MSEKEKPVKKEKPKDRLPNPVIPMCNQCQKPVIHCACKHNELKK